MDNVISDFIVMLLDFASKNNIRELLKIKSSVSLF